MLEEKRIQLLDIPIFKQWYDKPKRLPIPFEEQLE